MKFSPHFLFIPAHKPSGDFTGRTSDFFRVNLLYQQMLSNIVPGQQPACKGLRVKKLFPLTQSAATSDKYLPGGRNVRQLKPQSPPDFGILPSKPARGS
jgi:hypothetical protein